MSKQITFRKSSSVGLLVCLLCVAGRAQAVTTVTGQSTQRSVSPPSAGVTTEPGRANTNSKLRKRNEQAKVTVRDRRLILHVYEPQQIAPDAPLVFFSSGSGGWHKFDGQIASELAQRGMPVCGLSTHSYLRAFYNGERRATPAQIGADYQALIREARKTVQVEERRPVLLAGWSLGAAYAALAAADDRIKPTTVGVISVSISRDNETVLNLWHRLMSRMTGKTFGPSFNVAPFLAAAEPVPIAIIQAKGDGSASPDDARKLLGTAVPHGESRRLRLFTVESARNHSFAGGTDEFARTLDTALRWISTTNASALARPDRPNTVNALDNLPSQKL